MDSHTPRLVPGFGRRERVRSLGSASGLWSEYWLFLGMTRIQRKGRLGAWKGADSGQFGTEQGVTVDSWICRSGLKGECRAGAACLGVIEAVEVDETPEGKGYKVRRGLRIGLWKHPVFNNGKRKSGMSLRRNTYKDKSFPGIAFCKGQGCIESK